MRNVFITFLSIMAVFFFVSCGSSDEKGGGGTQGQGPGPGESEGEPDSSDDEEEQSFSDFVRETAQAADKAAQECLEIHLSQIDVEKIKAGIKSGKIKADLESGKMSVFLGKMDKACRSAIDPLYRKQSRWALQHKKLDAAIFSALHFRDSFSRVDLYVKRIGESRKKFKKKNLKNLQRHLEEARAAGAALKAAVSALDGVDFESSSSFAPARKSFLDAFTERFDSYLVGPVKRKTAMYHGISKFLASGLHKMSTRKKGTTKAFRTALSKLTEEYKLTRTVFNNDYIAASKSKKKRTKTIKKLVDATMSAL
jgi:hypothetical protein